MLCFQQESRTWSPPELHTPHPNPCLNRRIRCLASHAHGYHCRSEIGEAQDLYTSKWPRIYLLRNNQVIDINWKPCNHVGDPGCNGLHLCSKLVPLWEIPICIRQVSDMENNVNIVQVFDELIGGVQCSRLIVAKFIRAITLSLKVMVSVRKILSSWDYYLLQIENVQLTKNRIWKGLYLNSNFLSSLEDNFVISFVTVTKMAVKEIRLFLFKSIYMTTDFLWINQNVSRRHQGTSSQEDRDLWCQYKKHK